ncbi:MAG: type I-F CRISPR-associated protein Csy1 [Methylococcaceae bacterium]
MLDSAIKDFLSDRKAARIKGKLKSNTTESEKAEIESEANYAFLLDNWLPDAAKRAGQLSLASHPSKFSHPDAKTSSVIVNSQWVADGFVRSGNADAELDVFGNAAAMDVHKFLSLLLNDGKTVLAHLEQDTDVIQQQLTLPLVPFAEVQKGLLAIKRSKSVVQKTSTLVKQVYFPVEDDYHLLSILTPSGLMFKLRERINDIRFSEQTKIAREAKRKQTYDEQGFAELYDLSMTGFGGTKPQNISVLNSKNSGVAYLLQSVPPQLTIRTIQLPTSDFFSNTLYAKTYQKYFSKFHQILTDNRNNIDIRNDRDNVITFIINQVIERGLAIRQLESGWSTTEHYSQLPHYQKLWLDNVHAEEREINDEWVDKVMTAIARWFVVAYEKVLGKQALFLRDDELAYIKSVVAENQEGLR